MCDVGTGYSVCEILNKKDTVHTTQAFTRTWFSQFGTPEQLSADEEFNRTAFKTFLLSHQIKFRPRPSRRQNKIGFLEWRNWILKGIIHKINLDHKHTPQNKF